MGTGETNISEVEEVEKIKSTAELLGIKYFNYSNLEWIDRYFDNTARTKTEIPEEGGEYFEISESEFIKKESTVPYFEEGENTIDQTVENKGNFLEIPVKKENFLNYP